MKRPPIPKRLAAKIRSAQEKVNDARYGIIHGDNRVARKASRIAEYEANPVSFARRYYGDNPYDSYPVQTNISRCREDLEYQRSRRAKRIDDLVTAEVNLKLVEEQVLQEIARMRPTSGRVPWPRPLRSLEKLRHIESLINQRLDRESQRQRARDEAEYQAELKELECIARAEEEAFHKKWQEDLAKMSPEDRDAARAAARKIAQALKSGEITAAQMIDYIRNRQRAAV